MLLDAVANLRFEPYQLDGLVDRRRRYQLNLDSRFPLMVRPISLFNSSNPQRFNWHEQLELFVGVAGRGRIRMGDRLVEFARGDVVVVDNLKLHGLEECSGTERLGLVINFMPELVCAPASYRCDSIYLSPFYSRPPELDPILRATDKYSGSVHTALGKMVNCYFSGIPSEPGRVAGSKAYLLEALYSLALHFGISETVVTECDGRRRQSLQFGGLYEYLRENYSEPIAVSQAAAMVGWTEFRFMKFFKKATGMTFVSYLTRLRLSNAHRLLTETDRSIAEIAAAVGFADQSYFDRRFRLLYKTSPRQIRLAGSSKWAKDPSRSAIADGPC